MIPAEPGFQKRLGLFDGAMLVAGSMIGSGVYIVSAETARDTGGSGWLMAAWVVAGVMTVLGALSYAELAAMMPHAGGQYVYLREAYSPLWGFLYGWTSFLVIQTGTIAAVAVAFGKFLGVLVPKLGTGTEAELFHMAGFTGIPLSLPWLAEPIMLFKKESFTITAGQVIRPQRNLPLSLFFGTGLVIALYLLANVGYVASLPVQGDPIKAQHHEAIAAQLAHGDFKSLHQAEAARRDAVRERGI